MTFLDFFAGVGGFRRGMELAGHKCLGFCEWDKFARASYISMHCITEEQRDYLSTFDIKKRQKEILKDEYLNGEWCSNDIRSVDASNIPRADCWCFGAPCQDFSIAGKRAGLEGDRSSLVREVFRILKEIRAEDRPEWLIYENVKGMLSSNRGFDFLSILLELEEGGYDSEWQIFNSKDFGVPQNRERVYTIGHLRARGQRKIFPVCGTDAKNSIPIKQIGQYGAGKRVNPSPYRVYAGEGISPTLNCMEGGGREPHIPVMFGIDYNVGGVERELANTIKARYDAGVTNFKQDGTAVAIPIKEATKQGYSVAHIGDSINLAMPDSQTRRGRVGGQMAQTLDTQCNQAVIKIIEGPIPSEKHPGIMVDLSMDCRVYAVWYEKYQCYIAIRKLTPKECFRLQGWTDDYFEKAKFVNSDSQLYKQAGNGVTVNVVRTIGELMR